MGYASSDIDDPIDRCETGSRLMPHGFMPSLLTVLTDVPETRVYDVCAFFYDVHIPRRRSKNRTATFRKSPALSRNTASRESAFTSRSPMILGA